jgi:hypothetical protein
MRVLFFGAFGGVAVDVPLNAGATSEISLDGDIYTRIDGNRVNVGRATVGLDTEVITEELVTRFFVGAQVKLAVLHAYTHLNISLDKSVGLHMGVWVGI